MRLKTINYAMLCQTEDIILGDEILNIILNIT